MDGPLASSAARRGLPSRLLSPQPSGRARMNAPSLLTETEAADALRVCARTLRRLRQRGEIRYVAITRRTVAYRPEDLAAFVEQRTRMCQDSTPTRRIRAARQRHGDSVVSFT